MEDADGYKTRHGGIPDKQTVTDMIKAFCTAMEAKSFYVGWYCNKDWMINHLFPDQLAKFDFWYARPALAAPDSACGMWQDQIGETGGKFAGVNGACDTDTCFKDYPTIIKNAKLNGWGNAAAAHTPAPATAPQQRMLMAGSKIQYTGYVYSDSYGNGRGAHISGTYTVDRYIQGRKYGAHIPQGWIDVGPAHLL